MEITKEFKDKVVDALLEDRKNYDGKDNAYAKTWGIDGSIYNRLKSGERDGLISQAKWITIGGELNVTLNDRKWIIARTDVLNMMEEDVLFCKEFAKGRICVDDCGIGKTVSAKYLSRNLKNTFYLDAKQVKTKQQFVRCIAKTVGVGEKGRYVDVKNKLKNSLRVLEHPIIIVDDAGYLDYTAYMELLELVDATENVCGWYQIGDDSLAEKFERCISGKKVGYRAMFSRFSNRFTTMVPSNRNEKIDFYKKLLRDVISVNASPSTDINKLIVQCLRSDNGSIGDLRRAESLLILNS